MSNMSRKNGNISDITIVDTNGPTLYRYEIAEPSNKSIYLTEVDGEMGLDSCEVCNPPQ